MIHIQCAYEDVLVREHKRYVNKDDAAVAGELD